VRGQKPRAGAVETAPMLGTVRVEVRPPSLLGVVCVADARTANRAAVRLRLRGRSQFCAHALGQRASARSQGTCGSRLPSLRSSLTSGDHTAVATSTCPVARDRCAARFPFPERQEVAAEGALGIDHPVRRVDPRPGMGRASRLRGNPKVGCRASTRWFRAFRLVARPSGGGE
jgi:hypothetical protein